MRLNLSVATLAGALLFPLAAVMTAQQTQVSTVVVSVRDIGGATIPMALVHVRVYPPPERAPAATGDAGTFSFAAKPGKYDLFVSATAFETIAKRIEVQNVAATVLNLVLPLGGCPPGPCLTIEEYSDPDKVLSVSPDEYDRPLSLKVADLKPFKHQIIAIKNPDTRLQESYSGVSVTDLVGLSELTGEYVFVSGDDGYIAFPRAKLATGLNGSRIVVADGLEGRPLSDRLRAFLIENGQVTQSVSGIIRIRLLTPR